jgi:hypothetical protein
MSYVEASCCLEFIIELVSLSISLDSEESLLFDNYDLVLDGNC